MWLAKQEKVGTPSRARAKSQPPAVSHWHRMAPIIEPGQGTGLARSNSSTPSDRRKNRVPQRRSLASVFDPATPAKRARVGAAGNGCLPNQIGGNVEMGHLVFFHRFQTLPPFPPITSISTDYQHF